MPCMEKDGPAKVSYFGKLLISLDSIDSADSCDLTFIHSH